MQKFESPIALAQKLISLPSYVDQSSDEIAATNFIADYIQNNLPEMRVERQYIDDGSNRCNLIVRGKGVPKLFVLGHIDTVQPKAGWMTQPLSPTIKRGRLYGLGAADMKSSLAAFLWAVIQEKETLLLDNLLLLIYVDEEYDFKGMLRFVDDESIKKITPAMTLSLDGDLAVATGCRGVIELKLEVRGKSGHASNPKNGINAITETAVAFQEASQVMSRIVDSELGVATSNIAYLRGGTMQMNSNGNTIWHHEGNIIPDAVDVIFEVRTPSEQLNAQTVLRLLRHCLQERGLTLKQTTVRHDIKPWPVVYDAASIVVLKAVYARAGVPFKFSDRTLQGYVDAQIVAEKVQAPTFIIGTGGDNKHGANENVRTQNIEDATSVYRALLFEMIGGNCPS